MADPSYNTDGSSAAPRKEIYTYQAPWTVFSMGWSRRPDPTAMFRLAIGSYVEQYSNVVSIIKKNPGEGNLYQAAEFDHPYPCTKLMWSPDMRLGANDLLATTGDYLRIWSVTEDGPGGTMQVQKEALLNNNKTSEYCAPLTSFDWNETDPTILGTSSIDTTCTIWDVATQTARTQLIAHDREVFDLAFARGKDVFASVGADGSVRMFDLRSLEHSTIIYESPDLDPLLRLEWNKQDPNYLATFMVDSRRSIILDIRVPSLPVAELGGHLGCVNAVAWAPHSSCHICTAGDDSQALIWDLSAMPKRPVDDPILAYNADGEINNLQWSASQPDWVSIAFKDKLQIRELDPSRKIRAIGTIVVQIFLTFNSIFEFRRSESLVNPSVPGNAGVVLLVSSSDVLKLGAGAEPILSTIECVPSNVFIKRTLSLGIGE